MNSTSKVMLSLLGCLFLVAAKDAAAAKTLPAIESATLTVAPKCLEWGCEIFFHVTIPNSIQNNNVVVSCARNGQTVWTIASGNTNHLHTYSVGAVLGDNYSNIPTEAVSGSATCNAVLTTSNKNSGVVVLDKETFMVQ